MPRIAGRSGQSHRYNTGLMKRRLFTLVSAASLVLCLASAGLRMRSRSRSDCLYWGPAPHSDFQQGRHFAALSSGKRLAILHTNGGFWPEFGDGSACGFASSPWVLELDLTVSAQPD